MTGRGHCYRCDEASALCICGAIEEVQNTTPVVILQHPRERRHPFGTARFARLGLARCEVLVAPAPRLATVLKPGAALLFPEEGAPVLEALAPADRPTQLVAVDGTWSQAGGLRRRMPALAALPTVRLSPSAPSRYRVRREPHEKAISTLEAIVLALSVLEPQTVGLSGLVDAFDRLQDTHFELRDARPYSPRTRRAPRVPKALPAPLRGDGSDIVRLYAELHQPRGQRDRFPLRVIASRAARQGLFDTLVRSPIAPSCGRLRNMELGDVSFGDAIEQGALADRLRRLIRAGDTVVAWSQHAEVVLEQLRPAPRFLSLKHYCANRIAPPLGALDDVVARLGGSVAPWGPGRAGRQLAHLDHALAWLRTAPEGRSSIGQPPVHVD